MRTLEAVTMGAEMAKQETQGDRRGHRRLLTPARWLAGLLAAALAFTVAPLPAVAAGSDTDGQNTISVVKTAGGAADGEVATYSPGDTVTYNIVLDCDSLTAGICVDARLVDAIPEPLTLSSATVIPAGISRDDSSGNTVDIAFTQSNDQGTGLIAGTTVTISISAVIPADITWEQAQELGEITNTATFTSGTLEATDDAVIVIDVPEELSADATKTADDNMGGSGAPIPAVPGQPVDFTIGGANASNRPVDTITIIEPAAGSSNLEYLDITGIGPITPPAGADRVTISVTDSTGTYEIGPYAAPVASIPMDDIADPATVTQLAFTFDNSNGDQLPPATGTGDYASIGIATETNDLVSDLEPGTPLTVDNVTQTVVDVDGRTADDTASDSVVIENVPPSVTVDKGFDRNTLLPGETTTADIRVDNGGKAVDEMTISDPGAGGADFADQGLVFQGFDDDAIEWPQAATGVEITYQYADGSDETLTSDEPDTIPAASAPEDVVGFTITFTGPIEPQAYAVLPYDVEAQPVPGEDPVTTTNTVDTTVTDADGMTADDSDSADMTRQPTRVYPDVEKNIVKDEIYNVPGSSTLVQLTGGVTEDSTTGAEYLVVQDPADPDAGLSEFWNYFDLASIGPIAVPGNATMTASYLDCDTGEWASFPEMPVDAGETWSYTVPDDDKDSICGVQFVFTPLDGELLQPGFNVLTYFNVELRDDLRDGSGSTGDIDETVTVDNDAAAIVDNDDTGQGPQTDIDDDSIDIVPIDGGPGPDLVDKSWTPEEVVALSGATTQATLSWGTRGIPMETMTITDMADADSIDISESVFDAFDLASIDAITPATDPGILYDQVYAERLSAETGLWVSISTCTEASPCLGQFPQYTLSDTERADTVGIRFVFSERPDRAEVITDISTQPAVGSGVAETAGLDRDITLQLQLRNYLRSVPTQPVLGTAHDYTYNTGTAGLVHNEVAALGVNGDVEYDGTDGADITITDEPMNVTLDKRFVDYDESAADPWNDSEDAEVVPLPPATAPAADFPGVTALLRATNSSTRVATMSIADPDPAVDEDIFEQFNLFAIVDVTIPSGADPSLTRVHLSPAVDGQTEFTIAEAQALTPAQLEQVTSFRVDHSGGVDADNGTYTSLIASGATSDIRLEFQLRKFLRSDPTELVAETGGTPLVNHAVVDQTRPGADETGPITEEISDTAQDDLTIEEGTYGVEATKSIDPGTRTELDSPDGYVVTLTARPTGTIRSTILSITDATPTFWNAFDFAGFEDIALTSPIQEVRVDALTGVEFVSPGDALLYTCSGTAQLDPCWEEGEWVTASAPGGVVSAAELAASLSVDDADVRGLRFWFRTVGETHWERPSNPLITTSFLADRRATLQYDGTDDGTDTEVPSTRPGLDPAPGEEEAGVFTDTVVVVGQGSWEDEQGLPFTAEDTDTDTTELTHVSNGVSVTKVHGREAEGATQDTFYPGEEIPYSITVENTGDWPITGLTVTDQVETDAEGPMLVEPTRDFDDTRPIYTATHNGVAVDPFSGSMDADGLITFAFPADFVLAPDDTLVITAALVFRQTPTPIAPDTDVTNTATVASDRFFDTCDYTTQAQWQDQVPDTAECSSSTDNHPAAVGPVSTVKSVRGDGAGVEGATEGDANYDDLGVVGVNVDDAAQYCSDPNAGEGFYLTPCVPITRPGGVEQWRLQMTNSGNIPVTTIAGIDVLPGVGDTGVTVSGQRDSRWQPVFLGDLQTTAAQVGGTATVWYSAEVPNQACNEAEIQSLTGGVSAEFTACQDEIDNVRPDLWQPYSNDLPADVLASVRALKFTVTFDEGSELQPNATVGATFRTQTPWYSDQVEDGAGSGVDPIAWNSVAVGSIGAAPAGDVQSPVIEPRKVGVAMATGQLQLQKDVTGIDPAWGIEFPDEYEFVLSCVSGDEDVPLVGPDGEDLSVVRLAADGTPLVYNGGTGEWGTVTLPLYAQCTVSENGSPGAFVTYDPAGDDDTSSGEVEALRFSYAANVVNPAATGDPEEATITVTNTYLPGGFEVTKSVDNGGAEDQAGDPIAYDREFTFTAQCTLLDQTVLDEEFTLSDGGTETISDLPAGAECTVTETDAAGAAGTTIVVTEDGEPGDEQAATSTTFTVLPYDEGSTTALTTAAFTNVYTTGSVLVTKIIVDPGGWGTADFTVEMTCTFDGETVYENTATVDAENPTWQVDNLPTGAECVIRETESGGANVTSDPVTVVVGVDTDDPVAADITNTFTIGSLSVTKALDGAPASELEPATSDEYTVSLSCTRVVNGEPVAVAPIPGGAERTIAAGETITYTGLPTGAECTVTEPGTGFATGDVQISPDQPVVIGGPDDDPVEVTVTNVFENGSLSIVKAIDAPEDFPVPDSFTATVTCTWHGADVPLADGGVVTIAGDGTPTVVDDVPVGSVCQIAEDDFGQTGATVSPSRIVVDGAGDPIAVTVTNTYEWASLQVHKRVITESDVIPSQYEFHAVCTFQGETVLDETFTLDADETETITGIPARSECTVTETDARGADATITQADVPGANGDLAPQITQSTRTVVIPELPPDSTADIATVTYINLYGSTQIVLTKEFAGAGADQFGRDQTFTIDYACTFEGETIASGSVDLNAANDFTSPVRDVVVGAECTATEPDLQGADAVVITPNDGEDLTTGTVVVPRGGGIVTVTATNWYLTGSLEVTKTFAGDGAELYGTDDYTLDLSCVRDGETVLIPDGGERVVNAASPTALWTALPTGAECTLTEPDTGGANGTAIVDQDGTVVAADGEGYTFTVATDPTILTTDDQPQPGLSVQNTFNLAQVSVTKTVAETTALDIDGNPVEYGPFEVELACTWNGETVIAAEPMTQTIADGETITWTQLPEGAACTITETDTMDALATTVQITQAGATGDVTAGTVAELDPLPNVDADDQTSVAFVNEYGDPPITVTKVVDGTAAADFSGRSFAFAVRCVLIDASHPAPGLLLRDATYEIGGPVGPLVTNLPTGAECTITEVDTGGADHTTITVDGVLLEGTTVTQVVGEVAMEIVVTNTFDAPLPATGGTLDGLVPLLAIVLLALGLVAVVIARRRRIATE